MAEGTEKDEGPFKRVQTRKRAMPMIPEPFETFSISRQGVFLGGGYLSKGFVPFFPNLSIPEYREQLSDAEKDDLEKRADALARHTLQNHVYEASESSWEADVRNDVFGKIRDDTRLRIDKRPYELPATDEEDRTMVNKRIPDATMGLRCYTDFEIDHGYLCKRTGCNEDHSNMQPHVNLSERRIRDQMYEPGCGLVVDGEWGKTDIIFPWAVYEAKKRAITYEKAEAQVYHAAKTYLAMLDDLARDPNNVDRYQTDESKRFQMFCFTSCASYWEVFIAFPFLGSICVETIWEGSVEDFSRALDLICIVDQIHQNAVTQHRDFVIRHLERWHKRYDAIDSARQTDQRFHADYRPAFPGWYVVKEVKSRETAERKAALKRRNKADERERKLKNIGAVTAAAGVANGEDQDKDGDVLTTKRGHRFATRQQRTRKKTEENRNRCQTNDSAEEIQEQVKRGRGRPRKN